jgi:diguanylate cyclase (GGDEF)-like protein
VRIAKPSNGASAYQNPKEAVIEIMGTRQKELIMRLIKDAREFRLCGPSDDLDEQTAVTVGYHHLVVQLKRLASPILSEAAAARLNSIEVEFNNIYSAYEASAEIDALLPEVESALEVIDDAKGAGELDDSLPLSSRRQFDIDLAEMLTEASESAPLSLMLIDVDHFKSINDALQHSGGDDVLLGIASALKVACEGKGRCYRWGGDEMAALLPNYQSKEALPLAERLNEEISTLKFDGYGGTITLSIGIASSLQHLSTPEEFFKVADAALYAAKEGGRNRVCLAGGTVAPISQKTVPGLSQAEIKKRLDQIRLWVKLVNGKAQNFSFCVENISDEELVIKEIRMESDGHLITEPAFAPTPELWKVAPRGVCYLSWFCKTDPAASLTRMNDHKGLLLKVSLRILLICAVLDQSQEFEQRIPVQVKASSNEIASLV